MQRCRDEPVSGFSAIILVVVVEMVEAGAGKERGSTDGGQVNTACMCNPYNESRSREQANEARQEKEIVRETHRELLVYTHTMGQRKGK